jgi:hypothetical protein
MPIGQQFLYVAVGLPVSQLAAHRQRDHLTREPTASRAHDATFDLIVALVSLAAAGSGSANATTVRGTR